MCLSLSVFVCVCVVCVCVCVLFVFLCVWLCVFEGREVAAMRGKRDVFWVIRNFPCLFSPIKKKKPILPSQSDLAL